jgi:energy-converting hydrogenase Eha subunit C
MRWPSLLSFTVVLSAAVASACGAEPVSITLVFPSQNTFLLAKTATITVYEAGDDVDPDTICRNLSIGQAAGTGSPIRTTGTIDVCALREASTTLEDVPVGRLVVFAEVQGGGVILMKGCRVADVYATGTNDIAITLATLPSYPDNPVITCATVDEKCIDGQSCTES